MQKLTPTSRPRQIYSQKDLLSPRLVGEALPSIAPHRRVEGPINLKTKMPGDTPGSWRTSYSERPFALYHELEHPFN